MISNLLNGANGQNSQSVKVSNSDVVQLVSNYCTTQADLNQQLVDRVAARLDGVTNRTIQAVIDEIDSQISTWTHTRNELSKLIK